MSRKIFSFPVLSFPNSLYIALCRFISDSISDNVDMNNEERQLNN